MKTAEKGRKTANEQKPQQVIKSLSSNFNKNPISFNYY